MSTILGEYYLWLKSLHLIFVISWMAGLFYLPRLYVYHTQVAAGSDQDALFQVMERKLLRIIMNPALVLSWVFGVLLAIAVDVFAAGGLWVWLKLGGILGMTGFHMMLARWRKDFATGNNGHSERFYRQINEIPTLLMIAIVLLVVAKPL